MRYDMRSPDIWPRLGRQPLEYRVHDLLRQLESFPGVTDGRLRRLSRISKDPRIDRQLVGAFAHVEQRPINLGYLLSQLGQVMRLAKRPLMPRQEALE